MIRKSKGMDNSAIFTQARQAMIEARKSLNEVQSQLNNGTLDQSKASSNNTSDQFTKQSQSSSSQSSSNGALDREREANSDLMDRMMALIERLFTPLLQAFGMVASLQPPPPPPKPPIDQATAVSTGETTSTSTVTGNFL
jgi:hypothetical protein